MERKGFEPFTHGVFSCVFEQALKNNGCAPLVNASLDPLFFISYRKIERCCVRSSGLGMGADAVMLSVDFVLVLRKLLLR